MSNAAQHLFSCLLFPSSLIFHLVLPTVRDRNRKTHAFVIIILQIFIKPKPNPRGQILADEVLCKPNPKCYVCSERREITLKTNVKLTTVHSLENKFLKGIVHMVAPDVMISISGKIVISSEEGETRSKYLAFFPPVQLIQYNSVL